MDTPFGNIKKILLIFANEMNVKRFLTVVLIYISLMTNDVDQLFTYLLAMSVFFCKIPIHMFFPPLHRVFVLFSLICKVCYMFLT